MKNDSRKNGISLIVLVITIIIMIILAAAIIITLNNTGIIGTAESGVEKTNNKQTRLELELVLSDLQVEKYGDKKKITDAYIDETLISKDMLVDGDVVIVQGWLYIIDREKLVVISAGEKAKLNKSISITAEPSTTDYKTAIITINISGIDNIQKVKVGNGTSETEITEIPEAVNGVYTLTHDVTENGTYSVTVLDNNGGMNICSVVVDILEQDLVITTKEELVAFRDMVNAGATFEGKTITLGKDIDLNPGKYSVGEDGIIVFAEDAEKWTPIGNYGKNTSLTFKGTFNGNGHEISGLYINTGTNYQGFFGRMENVTIKNLKLEGVVGTSGNNYIGLLLGASIGGNIQNITTISSSSVIGAIGIGGIAGNSSATFTSCINNAKVKGTGDTVGGIVGGHAANCTLIRCGNNADIEGANNVGGIIGYVDSVTISESYNTGRIYGSKGAVGGILGNSDIGGTISQCYNIASVIGHGYHGTDDYTSSGGIAGRFKGKVTYSYNRGNVWAEKGQMGGIIGNANKAGTMSAQYCYNTGTITGGKGYDGYRAGAIMGNCYQTNADSCVWNSGSGTGYGNSVTNGKVLGETDLKAYTNNYFVADTIGVNDGYPILKWQLEVNK